MTIVTQERLVWLSKVMLKICSVLHYGSARYILPSQAEVIERAVCGNPRGDHCGVNCLPPNIRDRPAPHTGPLQVAITLKHTKVQTLRSLTLESIA